MARGRNVKVFEKSGNLSEKERIEKERSIQHFESLVSLSEKDANTVKDSDDPLIHWISYIKFHQDAFPSDTHAQFLLMERCTRALIKIKRYDNDVRFIRVCLSYADKTDFPGDVFKYLHKNKIGTKVAVFWVAWAWTSEMKGDFAFAEKVFVKGISKEAQPIRMLEARHKQFQQRFSRHCIEKSTAQEENEEEVAPKRKTFGKLSESRVRRNDRSQRSSSRNHDQGLSRSSARSSGPRQQQSSGTNTDQQSDGFAIFVDEGAAQGSGSDILDQPGNVDNVRKLETQAERQKENTMEAEAWNERGGYVSQYSVPGRSQAGPSVSTESKKTSFAVFVEEECVVEQQEKLKKDQELFEKGGRSIDEIPLKQREKEGVAEKLARDPMRYIINPSKLGKDKPTETGPSEAVDQSSEDNSIQVKRDKPTAEAKVRNPSAAKVDRRTQRDISAASTNSTNESVCRSLNTKEKSDARTQKSSNAASSSKGFQIFCEE